METPKQINPNLLAFIKDMQERAKKIKVHVQEQPIRNLPGIQLFLYDNCE